MRILALDQSESSCGFACWGPEDAKVFSGRWQLGSEYSSFGRTFAKLHEEMTAVHTVLPVTHVYYEKPRHLDGHNQQSSAHEHMLLVGLAAHIHSWSAAMSCVVREAHMSSWRATFLKGIKREKGCDLKMYAMKQARMLGFRPTVHDEAEAIGILDHACAQEGIDRPWRSEGSLLASMGAAA